MHIYTKIFLYAENEKEGKCGWMNVFARRRKKRKQEKLLGGVDKKEFHCFCVSDDGFSFLSW